MGTLITFAIVMGIIYVIYEYVIPEEKLVVADRSTIWFDIIILGTWRWVESETLKWFPKWSAGRFMSLLYYIFTTFFCFFIYSTLRTTLIAKTYEPPMLTNQDAAARDAGVYVMTEVSELE